MNLLGTVIRHETFGEGTILDHSGNYLVIAFAQGKKEFLYPSAFSKHITAVDPAIAESIKAEVAIYEASEAAISEKERLQRIATQNARREAIQKAATAVKSRKKKPVKPVAKAAEEPKVAEEPKA
jgi:hypothetical protein